MADRSATSVLFGFDFQANAAIVIMLENIKDLCTLRLEGKEDIEIRLTDDSYILAQAKSIVKSSSDFHNVLLNLRKSLKSLSDAGCSTVPVKEYIYITNSPNPFNKKQYHNIFLGASQRSYNSLPKPLKDIINKEISKIENPLNLSNYKIQILPFETDNDREKYKIVWESIREFISQIGTNNVSKEELHRIWKDDIFKSGTRKNKELRLSKNDIIWPIIVLAIDRQVDDDNLDESVIDELSRLYKETINTFSEKYEFVTKVLCAYNSYQTDKPLSERKANFIKDNHPDLLHIFSGEGLTIDDDLYIKLLQIIIRNILDKRIQIDKIKKAVNL